MDPPCSRATVPADMSTVRAPSTARSTPFRSSVRSSRASHCPLAWPSATYRNPGWYTCMPVGSTTVTCTSRFSSFDCRFAARVPRMPPIRDIRGPGQGIPRASMDLGMAVVLMSINLLVVSEDGDGAGGVGHEGRHALDVVDQWVQLVLRDLEQLHGERAGVDGDLADQLGLLEQVGPVLLAPLGRPGHGRDALRSRFGSRAVVLADLVGAERVEGPVLEQDVDLAAHGRPAHREHRRGRELVVGPREQDQGKRVVHAGLLLHGASVAPLASRYWGREARTLGAEGPIYPGGYGMRQWPLTCTDEEDWDEVRQRGRSGGAGPAAPRGGPARRDHPDARAGPGLPGRRPAARGGGPGGGPGRAQAPGRPAPRVPRRRARGPRRGLRPPEVRAPLPDADLTADPGPCSRPGPCRRRARAEQYPPPGTRQGRKR